MKLKINRGQFFEGLQMVNPVISARSTIVILGNVLMEAGEDGLSLTATDLDIRVRTVVPAKVEAKGRTSLPAKTISSIVREMPGEEISIEVSGDHQVILESGNSLFRLKGLAPDEYPAPVELVRVREARMSQAELSRILGLTTYSASTDESRKNLNSIMFAIHENTLTTVATDGKRLALVEKVSDNHSGTDGQSIVPIKAANELQRLLGKNGEVILEFGENQASFTFGSTKMITKLTEGTYPNYRQVIPTSFNKSIELNTGDIAAALRRVALVVSDSSPYVKLTFAPDALHLHAQSNEKGESQESLPINYKGTEVAVSFNPNYLIAPFRAIDTDRVNFQINDSYSPVAVSGGDGFLYVIMPMRHK